MTTTAAAEPEVTTTHPQDGTLPSIATRASRPEILERLTTASRRGRLPGFESTDDGFGVAAHGHPFDGVLEGHIRNGGPDGGRIEFRLRLINRLPIIFAIVIALTIWPGVYFMDELVVQFFPGWWRPWVTYYWYLPLTVIPIRWMWRSLMRKSHTSMRASALEAIDKIAAEVGGTVLSEP